MTDAPELPDEPRSPPPPKGFPHQLFGGIATAALAGVVGALTGSMVLSLIAPAALAAGLVALLVSHHRAKKHHHEQ